jgi:hypothetical protein
LARCPTSLDLRDAPHLIQVDQSMQPDEPECIRMKSDLANTQAYIASSAPLWHAHAGGVQ